MIFDRVVKARQDLLVHKDQEDFQDHLDLQARTATMVYQAKKDLQDLLVDLVFLGCQDLKDLLVTLVLRVNLECLDFPEMLV